MPEGVVNFRDLAQFRSNASQSGSAPAKPALGRFYRSDNLGLLTDRGLEDLRSLGVRTVLDLRRPSEVRAHPPRTADSEDMSYFHYDLVGDVPEVASRGTTMEARTLEDRNDDGSYVHPVDRIVLIYTYMLDNRHSPMRYVFSTCAEAAHQPVVFHCVAGQDRTGLVAAILLSLAGVGDDEIAEDYGRTADFNVTRFIENGLPDKTGLPIFDAASYRGQLCPPEGMLGTLAHLRKHYGSAGDYLLRLGLPKESVEALRRGLIS